jgi:hypothetical protein
LLIILLLGCFLRSALTLVNLLRGRIATPPAISIPANTDILCQCNWGQRRAWATILSATGYFHLLVQLLFRLLFHLLVHLLDDKETPCVPTACFRF